MKDVSARSLQSFKDDQRMEIATWNGSWDHLSLHLGQAGTLDMTSKVGPVQPVCVPGQIKRQDATISGKQVGLAGASFSKLQLDNSIPGCINKAGICRTQRFRASIK